MYAQPTLGAVPEGQTSTWPDGQQETPWYVDAIHWVGDLFKGNPRAGGADPCCPPGYPLPAPWPSNSNVAGAPPGFRELTQPSPSGTGRLKDDVCDCVPIAWGGRYWAVGELRNGGLYPGPIQDPDAAVWVEVSPVDGHPITVPGHATIVPSSAVPSSGGTGEVVQAGVSPLLALGLAGAVLALLRRR